MTIETKKEVKGAALEKLLSALGYQATIQDSTLAEIRFVHQGTTIIFQASGSYSSGMKVYKIQGWTVRESHKLTYDVAGKETIEYIDDFEAAQGRETALEEQFGYGKVKRSDVRLAVDGDGTILGPAADFED